jgi:hypothetical protein
MRFKNVLHTAGPKYISFLQITDVPSKDQTFVQVIQIFKLSRAYTCNTNTSNQRWKLFEYSNSNRFSVNNS